MRRAARRSTRTILLSAAVYAASIAGAWAALDDTKQAYVVFHPPYDMKGCTLRNAVPADLRSIVRDVKTYEGKCVRTSGVWSESNVYSGISGYYLAGPLAEHFNLENKSPANEQYRLGLYASGKTWGNGGRHFANDAEIIGRVGTCDDLNGPNVILVIGFCHSGPGTVFIVATHIRSKPINFMRLTGEKMREAFGNLREVAADWPLRGLVERTAQRWLAAIEEHDVAAFRRLGLGAEDPNATDADLAAITSGPYYDAEQYAFVEKHSSFAQFRSSHAQPQLALFRYARPAPSSSHEQLEFQAFACFCRENDCSTLWPISDFDAANAPSRPYICAEIWRFNSEETVDTPIDGRDVKEP